MLSFIKSRRFVIFLSCFGLISLLILSTPTIYQKVKLIRGESFAKEALKLVEKNQISQAWEEAQAAYRLAPQSILVNRSIATIYSLVDPQRALQSWEITVELSNDPSDRKKLVQASLKAKDLTQAARQLQILEDSKETDAEFYFLKAQYLYKENNLDETFQELKKALTFDNAPPEARLFYALLALNNTSKEIQAEGIEYFKEQGLQKNNDGLVALKYLASYPNLSEADYNWVIKAIEEHPLSTKKDLLLVLSLKERSGIIDKTFLIDKAKEILDSSNNLDDKVILGQWLNQNGYYEETLKQISLNEGLKRQDLFLVWVDAMAVQKQWSQLEAVFERHNIPLEEYLQLIFKSRIQAELGHSSKSQLLWDRMLLLIRDEPLKLKYALDYAFRLDNPAKLRATFKMMIKNNTLMKQSYEEWIYWEKSQGNLDGMMDSLRAFGIKFPQDPAIINDLTYGELLENKDLQKNLKVAQILVLQNPSFLSHRITLALALLKNDQPEEALNTLRIMDVDWYALNASYQAIYVAILKANDLNAEAADIMSHINFRLLLPEERALAIKE